MRVSESNGYVRRRRKEFRNGYWWFTLTRCTVLVAQLPKKADSRSLEAFSHVRISAHIRAIWDSLRRSHTHNIIHIPTLKVFSYVC